MRNTTTITIAGPLCIALLAAPLAACTATAEPELATHEGEIANQEVTYTYYDCAHPDVEIGWRFHACVATNAWSSGGLRSQCFEVDSQDCSNAVGTVQLCEADFCVIFDENDPNLPTYSDWARTN